MPCPRSAKLFLLTLNTNEFTRDVHELCNSDGCRCDAFDWTDSEIRIVNLKPSTKYALKVKAKNEVGSGLAYSLNIETERARK